MGKFHGMTRFTIADFNKGYWMVDLDPESRKYTMMASGHWKVSVDSGFQWVPLWHKMSFRGNWMQSSLACSRSHRHSWWHDHLWEEWPGTWQTFDLTFWKSAERIHWPWIQTRCCSDFHKFHSLDTSGVPRGSVQIQRKLQQWKGWIYPRDVEMMRSFLGLVNYLNRFSPMFSWD